MITSEIREGIARALLCVLNPEIRKALVMAFLLAACVPVVAQGDEWAWVGGNEQINQNPVYGTQGAASPSATPGGRVEAVTWTDAQGNLWLFGGFAGATTVSDMWELSPSTGLWKWVSGSTAGHKAGVYGTLGVASAANLPGSRGGAVGWTDANGDLWLFGGQGLDSAGNSGYLNDIWKYHPASGQWTWMGGDNILPSCPSTNSCGPSGVYGQLGVAAAINQPGGRSWATAWTDAKGNFWLFGGRIYGVYLNGWSGELNDLWTYDPRTNQWTWMGGSDSTPSSCSMLTQNCGQPGVYGTLHSPSTSNIPGAREMVARWTDASGNLWLMGGYGFGADGIYGLLNDVWRFNPGAGTWTWMSGSQSCGSTSGGASGVYGTWQTEAPANVPGGRTTSASWADGTGNLWLFGGVGFDATGTYGRLNDLWRFNTATGQWAWMSGSGTTVQNGVYGNQGSPSLANTPGARSTMAFWTDSSGNFWLFGGDGQGVLGNTGKHYDGFLSDLWKFVPQAGGSSPAATPELTPAGGAYTSIQLVNLTDTTPGATIYYRIGAGAAQQYLGPITVESTETIQAVASASGYANSTAAAASFTINLPPPPAPTFSPASGSFYNVVQVFITDADSAATIHYTTDGSAPTASSPLYSNGVNITFSGTLKAIAVAPGGASSPVTSASYTIYPPQVSTPTFSLPVGTYSSSQTLTVSDTTPGAAIYYTTDGSVPTISSPQYTAPIPIATTETVQAIAVASGYSTSPMATAAYTISSSQPPSTPGSSNEWTWMGGGFSGSGSGVYGTQGTPAPENIPSVRNQSVSWTDKKGNLWLFGGLGYDSGQNSGYLNDLWQYSPSSKEWTWMGGSSTLASGLATGVYGTLGTPASGNIPPGRSGAVRWTDKDGNFWLFGGAYQDFTGTGEIDYLNDLWKFDPSGKEWTWTSGSNTPNQPSVYGTLGTPAPGNVPGASSGGVNWVDKDGNLWLLEGNELWEFYPTTGLWAWMGGSGNATCNAVYGTLGVPAPTNLPGNRFGAVSWTDESGNFWMFGGSGCNSGFNGGDLNDLWDYNPSTHEWTWMGGSNTTAQPGVYGTLQTPASGNVPGSRVGAVSWTDSKGNFWLFGGVGRDSTSAIESYLNDLWEYNPSTNEWAWMSGSAVADGFCEPYANWCGQLGSVGTLQTPALGSAPSGRYDSIGWTDGNGNLWLFSGDGYPESGVTGALNDLWEYQPNTGAQPVAARPIISPDSGTFTSWQSVTIIDATPGAAISYLVNGVAPQLPYTGPITVSSSETIEAIASASGYANSNVASANFVLNLAEAAAPTFSVAPGTYSSPQTVAIFDTTPGVTIYYAIGPIPTLPSTLYTAPLTVSSSETIQAIAVADNYLNSSVATAAYNIWANSSAEWTWMGGSSTIPVCTNQGACGQPGWYGTLQTPAAANIPEGRWGAVTWTDNKGHFWIFGGAGVQGSLNDLWEYNPATAQWAWIAGNSTVAYSPTTGSGQPGVYGTLGKPSASAKPGSRFDAVGWKDKSGNLWLFGGWGFDANGDLGNLNDLWRFDLPTNQWTWMGGNSTLPCLNVAANQCWEQPGVYGIFRTPAAGNIPGGRSESTAWTDSDGNFWLYGGLGRDARDDECYLNDLWEFDPSITQWAWRGGIPDCPSPLAGWPGIYDDRGVASPENNPWSLYYASSWADKSGNLWLFGGMGEDVYATGWWMNDLWEFSPSTNVWAWMSGTGLLPGSYGSMGNWLPTNIPGARRSSAHWTDGDGNFWLFGGSDPEVLLNDLWEFKPSIDEWAWMGGSSFANCLNSGSSRCKTVYGALGTAASDNIPGGRYSGATWTDSAGNLWLFGGLGDDAQGKVGYLNDMWQYSLKSFPPVQPPSSAATPLFSLAAGTYASVQTLTISDSTPGAVIYYTTDGTMPNGDSAVYNTAITLSSSKTVAALAVANGYSVSALESAAYTVNLPAAATPTFSLAGGTYTGSQTVTLSDATVGAAIYYTTNGDAPTASSTLYNGAITISNTETISAIAVASGYSNSSVASASYTINTPAPTFSFAASPTSLTVNSGSQGSTTLTVTPQNGFNATVSFACTGLPANATCSFSPKTVTPSTAAAMTQLTIAVSALASSVRPTSRPYLPETGLAVVVCFFLWKRRQVPGGTLFAVLFACAILLVGCGGGSSGGSGGVGGSPQTYSVTVTATSGSLQQSSAISLTVN